MASASAFLQLCRTDTQSNKLYLYFWHTYSPVMYSLYEIDVPNPLPPPPTKDAQDEQIINPNHLEPILQLKTGEYPGNMCCVSLGSKLYFMGGEYDIDYPCIDEDVKIKYKNVKRDIFPRDVYIFDPTTHSLPLHGTAMNSGKSWPWAFVADEKIYVLGSNFTTDIFDISWRKDSELKSLSLFEVYHPKDDNWTILPNPPIGNVETRWVGHAVERRKVFFIAWQRGKERLFCFDLDRGQWTKHITLPSHLRNVSGRTEVIEGTIYGCYHNTIAAIAPVAKEEGEEEEEWEELEEEDELNMQQQQEEDEMGARFRNYRLHVVSREMGMNAIFNVPQQLQSSSTLLHLGSRCFCYVMTGMPPHPKYGSDHAIEDDKVRVISIVIFRALGETYKEDAIRLFRAKFLHSAHYAVETSFPNEGVIHGCFSLGRESQQPQIEAVGGLQGCHTQAMGKFQRQYQAERSPFDKQELGSNILFAAGRDHAEASAQSRSIGGGEFPVPPIDVSDSGTGNSSSQRQRKSKPQESQQTQIGAVADLQGWLRSSYTQDVGGGEFPVPPIDVSDSGTGNSSSQSQRRRRDDGERWTLTVPVPRIGNTEIPLEDGFTWRKYGQKEILGSKYPRGYFRCTHQKLYQCPAKKFVQRLDDDPYMFEVTYRGSHTCHMSSTAPSIPPPPDQISHDIAQFIASQPLPSSSVPLGSWISMDRLEGVSGMAIGVGVGGSGSGSGSGVGPSTTQSGKEVEFPDVDMADVMFNSDSSSSNSMDFLFQAPEDVK